MILGKPLSFWPWLICKNEAVGPSDFFSKILFVTCIRAKRQRRYSSITQWRPTLCDSHGLQHARPLSPAPRACSNSCPSSWWCHPSFSSSVIPFSSCLQSFPASGSFQMSQFFASSGQSIGVSASTSVLSMNIQDWFPLGWTGWISLQSKGLSKSLQYQSSKPSVLWRSAFFIVHLSHPYMTTGKTIQFSSVESLSCVRLCDPMNRSTSGLPVHHQLLELAQTHVHWVSDAIQPSHPLSSPSPPALNLSQNQGLFRWVSSLHPVAKVLEF